ncbi:hypothetical protein ACHAXR_006970, partial [Thalassiosira sp. AJA248-18]
MIINAASAQNATKSNDVNVEMEFENDDIDIEDKNSLPAWMEALLGTKPPSKPTLATMLAPATNATAAAAAEEESINATTTASSTVTTTSPSPTTSASPTASPMPTTRFTSASPSESPSLLPSGSPTAPPSMSPTTIPSSLPSELPSTSPSSLPSTSPPTLRLSISTQPTNNPSNEPSTSSIPSVTPSFAPSSTTMPSNTPTISSMPSTTPTLSFEPSTTPSMTPSSHPTVSSIPSVSPTTSLAPSNTPSDNPTLSPIIAPSSAPSLTETISYSREYLQRLEVSVPQSFTLDQVAIFQFLYEKYTVEFGYMVDKPTIVTNGMVLSQQIGINSVRGIRGGHDDHQTEELFHRRDENIMAGDESGDKSGVGDNRQLQQKPSYPLTMRFTMKYGTRVGVYDISNYNQLFAEYVNANSQRVLEDLILLGLPVVKADAVLLLKDKKPPTDTMRPTVAPVPLPTLRPVTEPPTEGPSGSPTTVSPTAVPSDEPTVMTTSLLPVMNEPVSDNSFALGLSLGLVAAFMMSAMGLLYYRHFEQKKALRASAAAADIMASQQQNVWNQGGYPGGG